MRVEELEIKNLLEVNAGGGLVRFAGQRALIFDAAAQGLLRKELIDTLGIPVARGLLTRFGYAHGRRLAEALRSQFKWDSPEDWQKAGSRIYALQGLFMPEPAGTCGFDGTGGTWRVSYEAEQHLLQLGRSDEPVCWTLCGLAGGYLSRSMGREVYAVEDLCTGRGDPVCHITVKSVGERGDGANAALPVFQRETADSEFGIVTEALRRAESGLRERTRPRPVDLEVQDDAGGVVSASRSPDMRCVIELARTIARVDSTVLITGESGTGKERLARFVHAHSARADGPFVAVNCAAISETLLESELFGHARGSFTGATADRAGLFEAADRGTLFLDEVGDIPLPMQVKLLRVLQEREVRRVGENQSRPINVRIITATNRDLFPEVERRRFREDLYYRLKVVELAVPPLRARKEDVLPLARILLAEASVRIKRPVEGFSGSVADRLLGYPWPGNVRELANVMERAVAVTMTHRIDIEDLPPELRGGASVVPPLLKAGSRRLAEVEKVHILAVLDEMAGNRTQAALALGIGTATLHRKLKSYKAHP